ncbi:hypothetical protein [Alcanivorax sediminis]|uniref:hypothetical protein n=1 Tax=Alcanivorax sediminis TaxID=2663008 RepID=UPI001F1C048E|nr:hypothetical protein [Alcanivorax sediminis]
MTMTPLRHLLVASLLCTGLFLSPVSAFAAEDSAASEIHPAIAQADAQREKEARRKRYLLLFPAAVIAITAGLVIITRRR